MASLGAFERTARMHVLRATHTVHVRFVPVRLLVRSNSRTQTDADTSHTDGHGNQPLGTQASHKQPGSTATANADFADYDDSFPDRDTGITQRARILR